MSLISPKTKAKQSPIAMKKYQTGTVLGTQLLALNMLKKGVKTPPDLKKVGPASPDWSSANDAKRRYGTTRQKTYK